MSDSSGCWLRRSSTPARSKPLAVGDGVAVAGAELPDNDANIRQIAVNLFSDNVFAFELTSVLLIVAVAGTVVLTRRERKPEDEA